MQSEDRMECLSIEITDVLCVFLFGMFMVMVKLSG